MTTTYFTITSIINDETTTEDFRLGDDIISALDELDRVAIRNFGEEHYPLEDGNIGFFSTKGIVYLEEKNIINEGATSGY